MTTNERPVSADDLVGILTRKSQQMAAVLMNYGPNTDWDALVRHLGEMYNDVMLAKHLSGNTQMPADDHAAAPAGQPN